MNITAGTWRVKGKITKSCASISIESVGIWIGDAHGGHNGLGPPADGFPSNDEAVANARLMVTAPAAIDILHRFNEKAEWMNRIQHSGGLIRPEDWSELYQLSREASAIIAKARGEIE